MFVNGKEIYKFKANNKNVDFPTQFCLGSITNKFRGIDFWKVFLEESVYDFLVDYYAIEKYDILDIHKYLIVKNKI